MALEPDETTLRDGFYLKQIGNRFVIFGENGLAVGPSMGSETLAVKRLIDHRMNHIRDQKEAARC